MNKKVLSASLLIAGTTIGAGMLGIPLMSFQTGFFFSSLIILLVWFYMYISGLLFLNISLNMKKGVNVISMTKTLIGKKTKYFSAIIFLFLYYCLMVAYFAAGTPIFINIIQLTFNISIPYIYSYILFAIIFGTIVGIGLKTINRFNYILMVGLFITYLLIISTNFFNIEIERFYFSNYKKMFFCIPILFSSFGYHNIIPSLTDHYNKDAKIMKKAILFGTLLPLIIYFIWQAIIIGVIPRELIEETYVKSQSITFALKTATGKNWIVQISDLFALFAIITSMLGISFSLIDFIGDGLSMKRVGKHRFILTLITFIPPLLITIFNPNIFISAINIAGGFGESYLNGILPAILFWQLVYKKNISIKSKYLNNKATLATIISIGICIIFIEAYYLIIS